MVGDCRACCADYYVAMASFLDAPMDEAKNYLYFNMLLGPERNSICSLMVPQVGMPDFWLLQEFGTPLGIMRHHIFGPWELAGPDGVIGPYGVSICGCGEEAAPWAHARRLLHVAWDALTEGSKIVKP